MFALPVAKPRTGTAPLPARQSKSGDAVLSRLSALHGGGGGGPCCCGHGHEHAGESASGGYAPRGAAMDLSRVPLFPPRPALPAGLQRKIVVGASTDPLEHEADRIADRVMAGESGGPATPAPARLSRKCAACEDEEEKIGLLQAKPASPAAAGGNAPGTVHDVLRSSGQPLDPAARAFFEPRFGSDFSAVRVHADSRAARSAAEVNARAYTVGRDIAFADRQYQPGSREGRRLIAHELAHVVQQSGAGQADGGTATVRRADTDAVSQVMKMGSVVGAGIQFFPTNVTDTVIGPVTVQGGLLSHTASRLYVIVGANLTPRVLARELLPLWTTATPFTPPGGGPAVPPGALSETQLAQGLMVYNRYFLRLPAMAEWRAGLHFPLPAEIDEVTGVTTVNPEVIRLLAGTFDPAWTPLLDQPAAATVAPPAATTQADVTTFLASEPTALARGIHLGARALTNAQASLPFVREAFAQLGANGFDVALAMMDELVNRDLGLLAAQRDGAAILAVIRTALAAAPGALGAAQQASLTRANAMLARVAGVAAAAPSAAVPGRAEKVVSVDTVRMDGSRFNTSTALAVANMIYAQCNVRFTLGTDQPASLAQTTTWLGADRILAESPDCGAASAEELAMFQGGNAAFGLGSRIRAYFVLNTTTGNSGYSVPPYCATAAAAPLLNMAVIANTGDITTLAHEIGHILLNSGAHPAGSLMEPRPRPNEITDPQCTTIYNNA